MRPNFFLNGSTGPPIIDKNRQSCSSIICVVGMITSPTHQTIQLENDLRLIHTIIQKATYHNLIRLDIKCRGIKVEK